MIRRKAESNRCGFSIVQAQVVVSITSVLLIVGMVWCNKVMKFSSKLKARQNQQTQLSRLARDFRADVQACDRIELADDLHLVLTNGENRIVYEIVESGIQVERAGPNHTQRDLYRLNSDAVVEFQSDGLSDSAALVVTKQVFAMDSGATDNDDPSIPVDLHVRAYKDRWPVEPETRDMTNGEDGR